VRSLIELIFDKKLMEAQMNRQGFDSKKMPLEDLSEETVKEGYKYLTQIETILSEIKGSSITPAKQ
jgi:hypothetical protein